MIEEFFKSEKEEINIKLENYFNNLKKNETEPIFGDFYDQLEEFIISNKEKAKRLHPILLITSFNGIINPMYLEEEIDKIRDVSLAVELLHSGHLIHDDLIDNDDLRRGKPTFHVQLKNQIEEFYKTIDIDKKKKLIKNRN